MPVAPPAAYAAIPLDAAFTRKARNTSNISAGWIAMNASRHAPRPRQNLTLRLSLAVRSRQMRHT
jgi:hypothetical protein